MFVFPHGIAVDKDDNVYVADANGKNGKGEVVVKFSPEGKVLMTLGHPGMPGDAPGYFDRPSAVAVAPDGTIYVADGHGGDSNARIVKLAAVGKVVKTWGKKGAGPGEFNEPHGIALDSAAGYSSPIGSTAASRSSTRTAISLPSGSSSGDRVPSSSTGTT
jgi:sugar lactone lactonase YvrE